LVDVRRSQDERFSFVRVERADDLPARDERIVDIALLDMNCGFANVGHDAIVEIVRAAASDVVDDLERDDKRVRVISYALRDRHMVPDYRSSRHMLYLGTGGPGHLDPRRNTMDRGAEEIREDAAWESPLWALFDAIADDERISLYGVCHTFGLICRWSGIAEPVLRGSEKGGAKSGVGNNVLTAQGLRHPYFRTLADVSPGGAIPVLDSRHYDLIPTGRMRPGATAIAFEANRAGERAGDALTMLEIARDPAGYPRVFACNNHPEIGAADDVGEILQHLLDIGTIDRETFERRCAVLPVLRDDRASERLRASRIVFGDLIRNKVRRLVRGA
jgi:hypothetical protein